MHRAMRLSWAPARRFRSSTPRSSRTTPKIPACPATTITTAWSPKHRHARLPGVLQSLTRRCCRKGAISSSKCSTPPATSSRQDDCPGSVRHGGNHRQCPNPHSGSGRAELLPARFRPAAGRRPAKSSGGQRLRRDDYRHARPGAHQPGTVAERAAAGGWATPTPATCRPMRRATTPGGRSSTT